ncbi:MAG: hypothetical protein QUV06_10265 [Cyanobium sp. CZS 48M]|nr:hypothetical protein [Cyanobium sp. CZS48M]
MARPSRSPKPSTTPANWLNYVPAAQRRSVLRQRTYQRLKTKLFSRSVVVGILIATYLLFCLFMLVWGSASLGLLAVLPLLLPPPVAYLAYWLIWREFHH